MAHRSQRYAKPLAVANDYIGPEFAGRAQESQGQQVGGDDDQRACLVGLAAERFVIQYRSIGGWILHQHAKCGLAEIVLLVIPNHHLES
jgi:hypothetical protein